jgi:predicted nuclease of predicted toxin-antitoxin system
VKLLVDMNLSPAWTARLAAVGIAAVHWSRVGAATASDDEILAWAKANEHVLLTHDLDFSAVLAATSESAPSVIQLRMQDLLSDRALASVVAAVHTHTAELDSGALMSIDESGARVRILPLRRT